jgi:tetratricopeptide (TPR) repeat protein
MFAGRYADAVSQLGEAQRLSESPTVGTNLGLSMHYVGRTTEAEALLERIGAHPRAQAALASLLAARGERTRAMALVTAVQGGSEHAAYSLGAAFAQLGDGREAVRWLERAASRGLSSHTWLATDPLLAPIRRDAGYQKLQADLEEAAARFRERYGNIQRY